MQIPKSVAVIMAGALILRLLFLFGILATQGSAGLMLSDSYGFLMTAENVAAGNGFSKSTEPPFTPDAHFPPLYPLAMAGSLIVAGSLVPLIIVQIILASFFPLLVYRIAGFLTNEERPRLLAAGLIAFEPISALWSVLVLTETFAVFFLLLAILFFLKLLAESGGQNAALAGLFLALSTLVRPHAQFLFIAAVVFLFFYYYLFRGGMKKLVVFAASFLIIMSPWLIRNYYHFETLSVSTTGPRNIYSSVASSVLTLKTGRSFDDVQQELHERFAEKHGVTVEEIKQNPSLGPALAKEGFTIIRENPADFAKMAAISLGAFFTQDLYTDYLQRFNVIPRFQIDFSPSVVLVKEGPAKLAALVWERLGPYAAIPVLGRIFWVLLFLGWLTGAIIVFRHGGGERTFVILATLIILYYAATTLAAGFGSDGRLRFPANPLMFILASYALFTAVDRMRNKLSQSIQTPYA